MIFQGSSGQTARKEFEIEGVTHMRLTQFKSRHFRHPTIIVADVFSGTGTNEVGEEIVYGSPIRILNGYTRARNSSKDVVFWFSDVRGSACDMLRALINNRFGDLQNLTVEKAMASDSINMLGEMLHRFPDIFLYLVLDPNGPKDFPKHEVEDLLNAFSRRVDVVAYISATAINRCIGARNKAGLEFKGWLGQIENFDQGFVSSLIANNRDGWIRKPAYGDPQKWTMLPTFGCMIPRNDWNKQGFVGLKTEEGREAVEYYCGGQNAD
jgi:hypothetical protein